MFKKIVKKLWGNEEWIVNQKYCGKRLTLNKGWQCSLHHHHIKDETFYIESGRVLMQVKDIKRIMIAGDSINVPPKTKHRFTGIEDSVIFEFSTHHEDDDSKRDLDKLSRNVPPEMLKDLETSNESPYLELL